MRTQIKRKDRLPGWIVALLFLLLTPGAGAGPFEEWLDSATTTSVASENRMLIEGDLTPDLAFTSGAGEFYVLGGSKNAGTGDRILTHIVAKQKLISRIPLKKIPDNMEMIGSVSSKGPATRELLLYQPGAEPPNQVLILRHTGRDVSTDMKNDISTDDWKRIIDPIAIQANLEFGFPTSTPKSFAFRSEKESLDLVAYSHHPNYTPTLVIISPPDNVKLRRLELMPVRTAMIVRIQGALYLKFWAMAEPASSSAGRSAAWIKATLKLGLSTAEKVILHRGQWLIVEGLAKEGRRIELINVVSILQTECEKESPSLVLKW